MQMLCLSSTRSPSRYMNSMGIHEVYRIWRIMSLFARFSKFLKFVHQHPLVHCIHESGSDHAHVLILQHPVPCNYHGIINLNCLLICWWLLSLSPPFPEFPPTPSFTTPSKQANSSILCPYFDEVIVVTLFVACTPT